MEKKPAETTHYRITASNRARVRSLVPKLVDLTESLLYPDIWERTGLSKRERSLATIATLVVNDKPNQLRAHLERGLDYGIGKDEIGELLTHLAFYVGWPAAMSAATVAADFYEEQAAQGS